MKKSWKKVRRIIGILMVVIMAINVLPVENFKFILQEVYAAETASTNGTCGENLTWELSDDGTLTISGTGEMEDYGSFYETAPWYDLKDKIQEILILEGVTTIGNRAFNYCKTAMEIIIPKGIMSIGEGAFCGCTSLTEMTIPEGVDKIGRAAFYACKNLNKIKISAGTIIICEQAFDYCDNLTEIEIPKEVETVECLAFNNCNNLTDVYYPGNEEDWNKIEIQDYNEPLLNANIHYNSTGLDDVVSDDLSHVVSFSPANGETNVDLAVNGDFNLDIYFDMDIEIGDGNIYICDYETGEIYRTVKKSDSEDKFETNKSWAAKK